jgi:hypothetical protein
MRSRFALRKSRYLKASRLRLSKVWYRGIFLARIAQGRPYLRGRCVSFLAGLLAWCGASSAGLQLFGREQRYPDSVPRRSGAKTTT